MSDIQAIASWWLLMQVFGVAVWPVTFRLFRWLPDRGYTLAKPLGLLLVSYTLWLLASFRILPNTPIGILIALILVAVASVWVQRRAPTSNPSTSLRTGLQPPISNLQSPTSNFQPLHWLREHRGLIIAYELLFALAFIAWAIFRAHAPDITTGEKPMELAFFNAIGRSASFPPHDPWLSGSTLAYYYFGYVMMSLLSKLSGVTIGVAFSLSNALWFALAAASAFSVIANLILLSARKAKAAAIAFGWLGAIMLVLMGNFEAPLEVAHAAGWGMPGFWKHLDILDLNQPPAPLTDEQIAWPLRSDEGWWWRAAQLIHDYPPASISPRLAAVLGTQPDPNTVSAKIITEFPQFSLLLGDMHPHTLNLPFVLLAVGLAVNVYQAGSAGEARSLWRGERRVPLWPMYPLILGGLGFMNTWDFPIYAVVLVAAFGLSRWQSDLTVMRPRVSDLRDRLIDLLIFGTLGVLFYLPFYLNFTSQVAGIWPNIFNGTRAAHFFIMFGPFITIGLLFGMKLLVESIRAEQLRLSRFGIRSIGGGVALTLAMVSVAAALGAIVFRLSPAIRAWFEGLFVEMTQRGITLNAHLLARLSDPWVPLSLGTSLTAIVLLWRARRSQPADLQSTTTQPTVLVLLFFFIGLLLTLSVEFGFIVDVFKTRMNTLFKFYYQAWVLWSVASAYGVYDVLYGPAPARSGAGRFAIGTLIASVIGLGLVYPALAIPTRATAAEPMLDAMLATARSPRHANADEAYAAVQWLNQNVPGALIILESSDDDPDYSPARSRISSWSGLPTLVGWPGHETQWRGNDSVQRQRLPDIQTIYATSDPATALPLLRQYGVAYVYVGHRERRRYPVEGLAKFDQMLPIVFQQGAVTIYRVPAP